MAKKDSGAEEKPPCTACKGNQTIPHVIYENGKKVRTDYIPCHGCNGTGKRGG